MQHAHRALQLRVGSKAQVSSNGVQGAVHDAEVQAEKHGSQGAHEDAEENRIVRHLQHSKESALKQGTWLNRDGVRDAPRHGLAPQKGCKGGDKLLNRSVLVGDRHERLSSINCWAWPTSKST